MDYLYAVDVSHWQGKMNWTKAKDVGVKFAFIKMTEGVSYRDDQFTANAVGCRQNDIPFAAYHYWTDRAPVESQNSNITDTLVKNFGSNVKDYPPIVLDIEAFPAGYTAAQNKNLISGLVQMLIDSLGSYPTIYTRKSIWDPKVAAYDRWKELPLWVAHYGVSKPAMPRDWQDWLVWQYSSEGNGAMHGASSRAIDLNQMKPAYLEYYGFTVVKPPEEPEEPEEPETPVITLYPKEITALQINGISYSGLLKKEE